MKPKALRHAIDALDEAHDLLVSVGAHTAAAETRRAMAATHRTLRIVQSREYKAEVIYRERGSHAGERLSTK